MVVSRTGTYKLDVDLVLNTVTAAPNTAFIWVRVNGTNVDNTATEVTITDTYRTPVHKSIVLSLTANDYVEVMFSSTDTAMQLLAVSAAGSVPAVPSARASLSFIAPT